MLLKGADKMDITKEIKKMLIDVEMTQAELADKLDTSQGNLANKLKRNNFSTNELLKIADVLGYELNIGFTRK